MEKRNYSKKGTMYVYADEVMRDMGISKPLAYKLIREWNEELRTMKFTVISGRVPRAWYIKKIYGMDDE